MKALDVLLLVFLGWAGRMAWVTRNWLSLGAIGVLVAWKFALVVAST